VLGEPVLPGQRAGADLHEATAVAVEQVTQAGSVVLSPSPPGAPGQATRLGYAGNPSGVLPCQLLR
jgi:hypothetical protein